MRENSGEQTGLAGARTRRRLNALGLCALLPLALPAGAQQEIALYDGAAPGMLAVPDAEVWLRPAQGRAAVKNVTRPTLTVFLPKQPNAAGTAVIVCPGGGYSRLAIDDEGYAAAKALNDAGIAAFVLKYRTARAGAYVNYRDAPLQDLRQAMAIVGKSASQFRIDATRIGVLGFSAGGHLAAMAATSASPPGSPAPAFTLLIYPVISFTDALTSTRSGTRGNLLGKPVAAADKLAYSAELHVGKATAPAFIVQAQDDATAMVGNSVAYYQALTTQQIPAQMHLYQTGGHGFGLYNKAQDAYWMPSALKWLALNRFYQDAPATVKTAAGDKR